ncbi:MAG: hypothetical protein MPJ22_00660 [Pirellulales bacterium]|nr:hypothetical protein [Pirellulales bacterium]
MRQYGDKKPMAVPRVPRHWRPLARHAVHLHGVRRRTVPCSGKDRGGHAPHRGHRQPARGARATGCDHADAVTVWDIPALDILHYRAHVRPPARRPVDTDYNHNTARIDARP